jgi:16S rRNA (guanine(966)-N(2))-methyltransferase RsmD
MLRIISGRARGRHLATLRGKRIRPTSDRIKESIFNLLGHEIEGKVVLDLFAGTGNLGLEALSRGAQKVFFVEKARRAVQVIQKNLRACGLEASSEILLSDAHRAIGVLHRRAERFDVVLMDPPYGSGLVQATLKKLQAYPIHHQESIVVVQHDRRELLPDRPAGWRLLRQRKIGDTVLSILRPTSEPRSLTSVP